MPASNVALHIKSRIIVLLKYICRIRWKNAK